MKKTRIKELESGRQMMSMTLYLNAKVVDGEGCKRIGMEFHGRKVQEKEPVIIELTVASS